MKRARSISAGRSVLPRVVGALVAVAAIAGVSPRASADEAVCVAASEISLGMRKQGKLHDALHQLAVCADPSCSAEVREECSQRVIAINQAMPTIIFGAKDGAGNDLADVAVSMDYAPLVASLDGRPVSVDPGQHTFRFETAGAPPLEKQLVIREGERDRVENVVLAAPPPTTTVVAPVAAAPAPSWWTTQRILAVTSAGVGVAGIAVGAILGAYALSARSDERNNCSSSSCGNRPQASEDYTTATHNATGSTVAFLAGGAFLAGSAVLWFTAPKQPAPSASAKRSLGIAPWLGGSTTGVVFSGDL